MRLHHRLELVGAEDGIGDEAMHFAHVHRLIDGLPAAAAVARMLADAPRRGGQRIVEDHGHERIFQPVLLIELQEARNVHVQRATVFAGRERQFLAHAGRAAPRENVIFKLVAEVPHGGEHRIGRRLSQAAERAVANVAAQFVQEFEMMRRARAFGDAIQNAQALVQADAAGDAFAARFRVRELDEVAGDVDHAVVFVHHDHAARAHDRAELRQVLVVDSGVEHLVRNATAGGAAGLHCFDLRFRQPRLRQCRR